MRRFLGCVFGDMLLQVKYGFYYIYLIVTVMYVVLLKQLPESWSSTFLPLIIFTDPAILGFFLISGLIFLEKGEGVLDYLKSTPLRLNEYILSKILTLSLIALLTSCAITLFYGYKVNFINLLLSVFLTSILFVLMGIFVVSISHKLNNFLVIAILFSVIIFSPLLDNFNVIKCFIFYIIPSYPAIILINSAFADISLWKIIYSIVYIVLLIILTYKLSYKSLQQFIILKEGV